MITHPMLKVEFDEENQTEDFKKQIAKDLNATLAMANYENQTDKKSIEFVEASIRLAERVSEFEHIAQR